MKQKTVYVTTDGQEFSEADKEAAQKHQAKLDAGKELKAEVLEDIQKILVKLQNINGMSKYDCLSEGETAEDKHLEMIKGALRTLVSANDTMSMMNIDDYYNSNC